MNICICICICIYYYCCYQGDCSLRITYKEAIGDRFYLLPDESYPLITFLTSLYYTNTPIISFSSILRVMLYTLIIMPFRIVFYTEDTDTLFWITLDFIVFLFSYFIYIFNTRFYLSFYRSIIFLLAIWSSDFSLLFMILIMNWFLIERKLLSITSKECFSLICFLQFQSLITIILHSSEFSRFPVILKFSKC